LALAVGTSQAAVSLIIGFRFLADGHEHRVATH
jgi:hypothetical protein